MHSLIEIVVKIKFGLKGKEYGCGIFMDLKKAFDTVNHNILMQKLEHYLRYQRNPTEMGSILSLQTITIRIL